MNFKASECKSWMMKLLLLVPMVLCGMFVCKADVYASTQIYANIDADQAPHGEVYWYVNTDDTEMNSIEVGFLNGNFEVLQDGATDPTDPHSYRMMTHDDLYKPVMSENEGVTAVNLMTQKIEAWTDTSDQYVIPQTSIKVEGFQSNPITLSPDPDPGNTKFRRDRVDCTSGTMLLKMSGDYYRNLTEETVFYQCFWGGLFGSKLQYYIEWHIIPMNNISTTFTLGCPNVYDNLADSLTLFETYVGSENCREDVAQYFLNAYNTEWEVTENAHSFNYDIFALPTTNDTCVVPKVYDNDMRYAEFALSMRIGGSTVPMCTVRCDYNAQLEDDTITFESDAYEADNIDPDDIIIINGGTKNAEIPDNITDYMIFADPNSILDTPVTVSDISGSNFTVDVLNGWKISDKLEIVNSAITGTGVIQLNAANYLARHTNDNLTYSCKDATYESAFTNPEIDSDVKVRVYPTVDFYPDYAVTLKPDANSQIPFTAFEDLFDVVVSNLNDLLIYEDDGLLDIDISNPIVAWNSTDSAFDVSAVGTTMITFKFTDPVDGTESSGTVSLTVIPDVKIDPTKVPDFGTVSYIDKPDGIYDMDLGSFITMVPANTNYAAHTYLQVTDDSVASYQVNRNGSPIPYGKLCTLKAGTTTFTITSAYDADRSASFSISVIPDMTVSGSYTTSDHSYNSGDANISASTGRILDSSFIATSNTPNINDYSLDDLIEFDFGSSNIDVDDAAKSGSQFVSKVFKFKNVNFYSVNTIKIYSKNPLTGSRVDKLAEFKINYYASSMFDEIPEIKDFYQKSFFLSDYMLLPEGATWADVMNDITFSGYDTEIVDVDQINNGKVIFKKVGETDMTVTTSRPDPSLGGASTRTFHIVVKQIPVITAGTIADTTIYYNQKYEVPNPFSSDIPDLGYENWTASVSNDIVSVTQNADYGVKVTPTGIGTTTVTLTNVFDTTKKVEFDVEIKPVITLNDNIPEMTVAVNSTNRLPIPGTIEPATADIYNFVTWKSGNKIMLNINDDNRTFTTKDSDLSTTITVYDATYPESERESHKASFKVTIMTTETLSDLTDIEMYKGEVITYPQCCADMSKVKWSVEGDDCVQLTNKHITALRSGVVQLTASMAYDPNIKKSCTLKVYSPVEKIEFANSGETYDVNDVIEVQEPIITPDDARIKDVLWSSSDPEVLKIDEKSGEILPIREGTVSITATATDGSGVKGSYGITITDSVFHEVVAVKVMRNSKVINAVDVAKDETVKLNYSVAPYNATNRDVSITVINADHPEGDDCDKLTGNVAIGKTPIHYGETIDITGKTEGSCKLKIKALDGSDVVTYITVNVTGEIVDSITFADSNVTLYTKDPEVPYYKNKVYGKPATGVIPTLTYVSSDPEIASVDGSGRVTAKKAGTVKITASYKGSKKELEASYIVDVIETVLVESLKFENESATIDAGKTDYKNKLIITPSNATNPRIKYYTSDATVASVNAETGVVKPVKPGEVTITAAANDGSGKVAYYTLVVKPIYVTSIEFENSSVTISELDTKSYKNPVKVSPENASNKQLKYSSSDSYVARVDSTTGAVTSVYAGTCTITAVAQDGSGVSGSYTVNVTEGETPAVKNIHWDNELQGLTWDDLEDKYAIGYVVRFDRKSSKKDDDEDTGDEYIACDSPLLPVEDFGFTPTAGTTYKFKVWAVYKGGRWSKYTKGDVTLYRITFYPGTATTKVTSGTGTDAKTEEKTVTPSGTMSPLWGGKDTDYKLPECGYYAKGFDFAGWMVNNGSPQPAGSTVRITGMTHIEATWTENEESKKSSASGIGNGKSSELTSLDALHAYSKIGAFNDDFTTFTPLAYTELINTPLREKMNHGMLANYCTSVLNNYYESKFTAACVDMAVVSPGPNIECPETWKNGRRNIFWASPLAYASDTIFAIWYCDETKQLVYLPCEVLEEGEVTFRVPRVGWSSVISLWKLEDEETVKYFGADTWGIKGIAINMASKGLAYREGTEMSGMSYDVNQGILPPWNSTLGVGSGLGSPEQPSPIDPSDPYSWDIPEEPTERISMPNVVGYKAEEAKNILANAGITSVVEVAVETGDPSSNGVVIIQNPSYGAPFTVGSDKVKLCVGLFKSGSGGDSGGYTPQNNVKTQ